MLMLYAVLIALAIEAISFTALTLMGYRIEKPKTSSPVVLIDKGKIDTQALSDCKKTIDDLTAAARLAGYFNLADVDYSILEANGELSFLPKPMKRSLTPKDFNFAPVRQGLCKTVVLDGRLVRENIKKSGVTEYELLALLEQRGRRVEDILFATIDESGRVDVFEK